MDQIHSMTQSSSPDKVLLPAGLAGTSALTCDLPVCSESAIEAIQPKPGSPAWLVEEVEAIRRGLMDLLHNVVLLRCPDSDKEFTPVSFASSPHLLGATDSLYSTADSHSTTLIMRKDIIWYLTEADM